MTLAEALHAATLRLRDRAEARILVGHALGLERAAMIARPEAEVDSARFEPLLRRREAGEPLAYILGSREFYGRAFLVNRDVLIPRAETETLVEAALSASGVRVLDVGAGSGCVGVTLALEDPSRRMTAVDLSSGALAVASSNGSALGAPIGFVQGDLTGPFQDGAFDLVVTNPPYVETDARLSDDVRREPALALFAGQDGMDVYRRLAREAGRVLSPDGLLLTEVGDGQAPRVAAIFQAEGWTETARHRDGLGHERVLAFRRPA